MGIFDLPRNEVSIHIKGEDWKSIAFTDYLTMDEVMRFYQMWSEHYEIDSIRYTVDGKNYVVYGKALFGETLLVL